MSGKAEKLPSSRHGIRRLDCTGTPHRHELFQTELPRDLVKSFPELFPNSPDVVDDVRAAQLVQYSDSRRERVSLSPMGGREQVHLLLIVV